MNFVCSFYELLWPKIRPRLKLTQTSLSRISRGTILDQEIFPQDSISRDMGQKPIGGWQNFEGLFLTSNSADVTKNQLSPLHIQISIFIVRFAYTTEVLKAEAGMQKTGRYPVTSRKLQGNRFFKGILSFDLVLVIYGMSRY